MPRLLSLVLCMSVAVLSGCKTHEDLKRAGCAPAAPERMGEARAQLLPAAGTKSPVPGIKESQDLGGGEEEYLLGVNFAKGEGVPQDYAEACRWFRLAAESGNAQAEYSLGIRSVRGEGTPVDFAEAARWFRKAAFQGLPAAQFSLAIRYVEGKGVPRDYIEAYKWFTLARAGGHARAAKSLQNLEKNEKLLTPEQIEEAKARAAELLAHIHSQ